VRVAECGKSLNSLRFPHWDKIFRDQKWKSICWRSHDNYQIIIYKWMKNWFYRNEIGRNPLISIYNSIDGYNFLTFNLLLSSGKFNFDIIIIQFWSCAYFCRKLLMRWTVLSSDALIFFPAVLYFIVVHYNQSSRSRKSELGWHTAALLLSPCLILIDHGHFQVSKENSSIVLVQSLWFFAYFSVTGFVVR